MRKTSRTNPHGPDTSEPLLSRDVFRESVFARDGHACVICGRTRDPETRLDAHHIIERRLFTNGGYYLSNGATLCDRGPSGRDGCHLKAEQTLLSVEDIRHAAGISTPVLPAELYPDHVYDKWGNAILSDGTRTKGPLLEDESVRKVLEPVAHLFRGWVKYPRTWHLPWSAGVTDDDKVLRDLSHFEGQEVVVTRKMDGENTSLYSDGYLHARSVDGRSHPSRDWAKAWWAHRAYDLPDGWRIVAENLYARHAITYEDLPSYVMGFAIYDEHNRCLGWDATLEWFALLDIEPVPVLWRGIWDADAIQTLYDEARDYDIHEGYVVRLVSDFAYGDFARAVAKFVRADHVRTTKHWARGPIVPNAISNQARIERD